MITFPAMAGHGPSGAIFLEGRAPRVRDGSIRRQLLGKCSVFWSGADDYFSGFGGAWTSILL